MDLDKNGDMRLDIGEINGALDRAGIDLPRPALEDFITSMASSFRQQDSACPSHISFPQFRDYLLLLPREASVNEVGILESAKHDDTDSLAFIDLPILPGQKGVWPLWLSRHLC
jgi:hypothetical protein